MVGKGYTQAGVGVAKGNGANATGNYNYVVVFFGPGQSEELYIHENVLPAAGRSQILKFHS